MEISTSLMDAIVALVNEPDWSKRKQIVERHRDLLLGAEAANLLEAAVVNNAARPQVQKRFRLCQSTLADCRAMGIDAAFVLAIGPTPGLENALKDLLCAGSVAAAHETTIRQQALLLTDEADWVLAAFSHESPDEALLVERIAHRRELLARCRQEGIELAFEDMLRDERLSDALQVLGRDIDSREKVQIVLEQHQDILLTDQALDRIRELTSDPGLTPEVERVLDALSRLLSIARTDGVATASLTYMLAPFEQFLMRCFFAVAKPSGRDLGRLYGIEEILREHLDQIDTDFPEKLLNWSRTEEMVPQPSHLTIYAAALARLGEGLRNLPAGDAALNKEAGTACFQAASRFSQGKSHLSQKRARKEHVFQSVEDAVAAATRMKMEGGYDLFRGQRCAWPVASSFRRLAVDRRSEAESRIDQFMNWVQTESALAQYGFSSDQAIAVAQHYGIPTTFLDFSTDIPIARYFATEHCLESGATKGEMPTDPSCIIAIRSAHLEAWVKERFQQTGKSLGPQILRFDVANLWRLEAQAGVFLVDDKLLDDYPFDYLLFPASITAGESRGRATVYPEERSDLELMIEQWFWHEKASAGTSYILERFEEAGVAFNRIEGDNSDGIGLKGIMRPQPDPSWLGLERAWLRAPERLDQVRPQPDDTFRIALRHGISVDDVRDVVAEQLPLHTLSGRRRRSANWQLLIYDVIQVEMSKNLERQWDALRIDGYSDEQIIESFNRSVSLAALQLGLVSGWEKYEGSLGLGERIEPLTALFGSDLLVEFGGLVGYSRALVEASALRSAVRDDIDRYLPIDLYTWCGPSEAERMRQLLIGIYQPNLLFDFFRFADIYVRQLIPMSVIFRPDLPLYPVLHLQTLGVP